MNPATLAERSAVPSARIDPPAEPLIELRGVTKVFGRRTAVADLNLTVFRGEIHGLLGHNGAGKSTAIGMMLGQVWPTKGDVFVCGADVIGQRRQALARVGAIFETPVFHDYLTGRSNLEILATYSAPVSPARLAEVIDWVGLTGRENSKVSTYSHGMRTRLALAQALLPNPELLILDEPSDGLDPEGIHEMRATILRLRRELGLTILLSSHLLTEVERLCDRLTVIRQGRKLFSGDRAEARHRRGRVQLVTDNFNRALALLQAQGWLTEVVRTTSPAEEAKGGLNFPSRRPGPPEVGKGEGGLIGLPATVPIADVVRFLVKNDIAVHAIAPHEETLEEYYLSLMQSPATH
jgi:ABC-2 type transport system ATP-binding protein